MRIWKNIKWAIFNHPPTALTDGKDNPPCSYCKANKGTWNFENFCICYDCMKKAFDKSLSKEEQC